MRVISVDGPFNSRVLVDMSADEASRLLEDDEQLSSLAPSVVSEGVERDIASIARGDDAVAGSALAGAARVLAWQMENPYASATAKSMCSKELRETLERLRALAPPVETEDEIERARKRRAGRLARQSAAGAAPPS